jgi:hypothetical protein
MRVTTVTFCYEGGYFDLMYVVGREIRGRLSIGSMLFPPHLDNESAHINYSHVDFSPTLIGVFTVVLCSSLASS